MRILLNKMKRMEDHELLQQDIILDSRESFDPDLWDIPEEGEVGQAREILAATSNFIGQGRPRRRYYFKTVEITMNHDKR